MLNNRPFQKMDGTRRSVEEAGTATAAGTIDQGT